MNRKTERGRGRAKEAKEERQKENACVLELDRCLTKMVTV